jgi:hypothetical protein
MLQLFLASHLLKQILNISKVVVGTAHIPVIHGSECETWHIIIRE